jgi:hypothetical protein
MAGNFSSRKLVIAVMFFQFRLALQHNTLYCICLIYCICNFFSSSFLQGIGFADIHVRQPEGDILIFMTGQVNIFVTQHLHYNNFFSRV